MKFIYQRAESVNLCVCSLIDCKSILQRIAYNGPKAYIILISSINDFLHRSVSDSSCRIIDDTLESLFVIRIDCQSEIGNNILDFLALIKRKTSVNSIRIPHFPQFFLEHTALCIGSVKNGKARIVRILTAMQFLDFLHHNVTFFHVGIRLHHR